MNFDPRCQVHFAMLRILFCCCPIKRMRLITRVYGTFFMNKLQMNIYTCMASDLHFLHVHNDVPNGKVFDNRTFEHLTFLGKNSSFNCI